MASWLASTGSTAQGRVVDIFLFLGFYGADFLRNFQRVGLGGQGIGTHSLILKYILDRRQSRLPLTLFLQMEAVPVLDELGLLWQFCDIAVLIGFPPIAPAQDRSRRRTSRSSRGPPA